MKSSVIDIPRKYTEERSNVFSLKSALICADF